MRISSSLCKTKGAKSLKTNKQQLCVKFIYYFYLFHISETSLAPPNVTASITATPPPPLCSPSQSHRSCRPRAGSPGARTDLESFAPPRRRWSRGRTWYSTAWAAICKSEVSDTRKRRVPWVNPCWRRRRTTATECWRRNDSWSCWATVLQSACAKWGRRRRFWVRRLAVDLAGAAKHKQRQLKNGGK